MSTLFHSLGTVNHHLQDTAELSMSTKLLDMMLSRDTDQKCNNKIRSSVYVALVSHFKLG
jgi:hypothetical protein